MAKLSGKQDQPVSSVLPHGAALKKSAFWSTPNVKSTDGAKKAVKPKNKVKSKKDGSNGKPTSASSNANRAERRRVKKERKKSSISSK